MADKEVLWAAVKDHYTDGQGLGDRNHLRNYVSFYVISQREQYDNNRDCDDCVDCSIEVGTQEFSALESESAE